MRDVRVIRKLRSRSNHANAPQTQRIRIRRNGIRETVQLPLEEYPVLLHFPIFAQPGVLIGHTGTGIQLTGFVTIQFGPRPELVAAKLGAQEITWDTQPDHPIEFAKMIGKIGYAMAVAQGVLDITEHRPEIVASLLGELDEIGRWVGTAPGPFRKHPAGTLHRIDTQQNLTNGRIAVEIQLFADSDSPTYVVVLR